MQPTCGTSLGSIQGEAGAAGGSRRIQAPLEGTEASQEGGTELPLPSPRSAPRLPRDQGAARDGFKMGPAWRVTRQLNPTASRNGGTPLEG